MELVTTLPPHTPLREVPALARRFEKLGFDTIHIPETIHDSLTMALLALEHTRQVRVRTSMTLAFTRSPMVVAYSAWDLAQFSGGRFELGLATQVRGNIVGRFSMPWGEPAERLADYLAALRAIFHSFQTGAPLDHHGSHYTFTRLQPYFNPGPILVAPPLLYTGGVNTHVCRVGGAHADGFVTHPTNCHPKYLRGSVLPTLRSGAQRVGRDRPPRVVVVPKGIVAPSPQHLQSAREESRRELAFLYSTPAYRPTLELFGYEDLGEELSALVKAENWGHLARVLTDEVMDALIPQGTYAEYPQVLHAWYSGLCQGLAIDAPVDPDHDRDFSRMLAEVRDLPWTTTTTAD